MDRADLERGGLQTGRIKTVQLGDIGIGHAGRVRGQAFQPVFTAHAQNSAPDQQEAAGCGNGRLGKDMTAPLCGEKTTAC